MEGQVWRELYRVVTGAGRTHDRRRKQFSDARVALAFLWSAPHDRPRCRACATRPTGRRRGGGGTLPSPAAARWGGGGCGRWARSR